jgi:DNA-binding protein YbaB
MSDGAAKPAKDTDGVSDLFDVSCTARSSRGLITATVDSGGYPTDIQIDERAMRLTAVAMREEVLSALQTAHRSVSEQMQDRLRDFSGDGEATARGATDRTWQAADEVRQSIAQITGQFEDVRRRLFKVLDGP